MQRFRMIARSQKIAKKSCLAGSNLGIGNQGPLHSLDQHKCSAGSSYGTIQRLGSLVLTSMTRYFLLIVVMYNNNTNKNNL